MDWKHMDFQTVYENILVLLKIKIKFGGRFKLVFSYGK